ncbi:hypothetical protein P3T76_007720 [Phytophthora citrophthora]|uniref:RxLR effector protein n=1 Tax=Phytophthora citrophthora TaxID=4793 RepID=A0AAD9GMA2_9STRA|nr:hypothetical protein P3T76_007720 [Phytophthora citrophthora]
MNATFLLTVFVAAIIANGANVAGAEDTARANPESHNKRLRDNLDDEERVAVAGAAWYATHVMNKPSKLSPQTSQQILHSVQNDEPLPKWAKAIIVLVGLGVVSGAAVAGVKISQTMVGNGEK